MADNNYNGSVELGAGIIPKNGQTYPLATAHDIHVYWNSENERLDDVLSSLVITSTSSKTKVTYQDGSTVELDIVGELNGNSIPNKEDVVNVVIGDAVRSIGDGVFSWCSGLTSITIPDSVTSIGYREFYGCGGLTSVTIPDSVTSVGEDAFNECDHLTSLVFEGKTLDEVKDLVDYPWGLDDKKSIIHGDPVYDLIEQKADKAAGATAGNLAGLSSDGNLVDSGVAVSAVAPMQEVTYDELVLLRTAGRLIPGRQYRITDYVATTTTTDTQSANHGFDVIVTADAANKLNEAARAALRENDTYFANSRLEAWKIWYSLDNSTERFAWADRDGKGVVYRLIDEYNNDLPYDFKGILFKAYGDSDNAWRYTFDDGSTDQSVSSTRVYNNSIAPYTRSGACQLNFIVFKGGDIFSNTFGTDCRYNTFSTGCYANTFSIGCEYNTFGAYCEYNTFGSYCDYNTFGSSCSHNTFGSHCEYIKFGTSSETKSGCRYIRVDSGNQHIYINPTGEITGSTRYQNVEIKEGVNNTETYKTISDPNVGQTFLTTYKPADSREVSV